MKAWVLEDIGNIKYKEVLKPQISENEVLVQVKAAGICGSDIPRIYQTGAHQMPLIPGHEFSGQVVQTGENADVKWQNKRVGIFPLIMSCAEITVISVPDGTADLRSMLQCRSATSLNCRKMFHMRKRQCLNRCRWHATHCAV